MDEEQGLIEMEAARELIFSGERITDAVCMYLEGENQYLANISPPSSQLSVK